MGGRESVAPGYFRSKGYGADSAYFSYTIIQISRCKNMLEIIQMCAALNKGDEVCNIQHSLLTCYSTITIHK